MVAQTADQQAQTNDAGARDHYCCIDGVARNDGGSRATREHHGDDQSRLDDRDCHRENQYPERLAYT